ncbi:MAG: sugar ABC transporter permease [Acholeplasmatales bacterium]|nr:MAG: sugar ABC transporter permease [Acholeplasmatales bacterium]
MQTLHSLTRFVLKKLFGHFSAYRFVRTAFEDAGLRQRASLCLSCLVYGGGDLLSKKWDLAIVKALFMGLVFWIASLYAVPVYSGAIEHAAFNMRVWLTGLMVFYLYLHTRHIRDTIIETRTVKKGDPYRHSLLRRGILKLWVVSRQGVARYLATLRAGKVNKTLFWLLSPYIIMGLYQAKTRQWHKAVLLVLIQGTLLSYILSVGVLDILDFVALDTDFRPSTFNLVYGFMALFAVCLYMSVYVYNIVNVTRQISTGQLGNTALRDDLRALRDERLPLTLLSLPVIGVMGFTIIPLIFMISIAFTSYTGASLEFRWQGFEIFRRLIMIEDNLYTLVAVVRWTLIWAVLATFTNYFGGIMLSLLINKKGVRGKKVWRTIFIITMATPQFVSLLIMNQMFAYEGPVNQFLLNVGLINENINFWGNQLRARTLIIIVNMWVGIPYLMLLTSGILMNIPEDLYEAARIEGASKVQAFLKITMPYMFYITTPLLLMQFIGNMNNFNVIYLLTQGRPYGVGLENAGGTDILITWLYQLTRTHRMYNLSAAIGIIIFVLSASISISIYRKTAAYSKEGEFS